MVKLVISVPIISVVNTRNLKYVVWSSTSPGVNEEKLPSLSVSVINPALGSNVSNMLEMSNPDWVEFTNKNLYIPEVTVVISPAEGIPPVVEIKSVR